MSDRVHVIAGRCTAQYREADAPEREHLGDALVVCKSDDTLLVHDAEGYRPVAWLTRAEALTVDGDVVTAIDGDRTLRVTVHERYGGGVFPAGTAGEPVGDCPDCDGRLTRAAGAVTCGTCGDRYGVPDDATVLDETCEDCDLPRFSVARGEEFSVCLDRHCESLDEQVAAAFDRAWECPNCGDDLRVLRRGGLVFGCASYPACETALSFPAGEVVDTCECELPVFETATGRRCLDSTCDRAVTPAETPKGT